MEDQYGMAKVLMFCMFIAAIVVFPMIAFIPLLILLAIGSKIQ